MRRILVMDDDGNSRLGIAMLLEGQGFKVMGVENGEEAVVACKQAISDNKPIDIAVLDKVIIGGMGALETIKELRAISPKMKTVISSGYYDDPAMIAPQDYGFDLALEKPFSLEELMEAINSLPRE